MDRVVTASVAQQMPEDPPAEPQRGTDAAVARGRIETAAGPDVDCLEARFRPLLSPLAPSQIGDAVGPVETFGDVAVPALGAADRVRERQS